MAKKDISQLQPIAIYENGWKTFFELFVCSVYEKGRGQYRITYKVYNECGYTGYDKKLYTNCEYPYFIHDGMRLRLENCTKIDIENGLVLRQGEGLCFNKLTGKLC